MQLSNVHVFMVGIKGTGMATLAVMLCHAGAVVSGCDTSEVFATDDLLHRANIPISVGFAADLLPAGTDLVIHSSAWNAQRCPVLAQAAADQIATRSYAHMLGWMSEQCTCYGVAGTHGKTTTTGCAAWLLSRPRRSSFPFFAIYGSAAQGSEAAGVWQGDEVGLLEACEYQDHFLLYRLRGLLVTNVGFDHPDYFADLAAVTASFQKLVSQLAVGGFLICCADDPGSRALAHWATVNRKDLMVLEYGYRASGPFQVSDSKLAPEPGTHGICLSLLGYQNFGIRLYGPELTDDVVGGCLLATCMLLDRKNPTLYLNDDAIICDEIMGTVLADMLRDAQAFGGCVGRSEVMLQRDGITYIDDYAHHPVEITATLESLRHQYPNRRIVVAFSPHTASRSKAFFKEFVHALSGCDALVVQGTYASARNDCDQDLSAKLAQAVSTHMLRDTRTRVQAVIHASDDVQVAKILVGWLQDGDLCVTMGAGNNRALSQAVATLRAGASL